MSDQKSDFQGILTLNKHLVDQLHSYLEERETKACQALLNVAEVRLSQPGTPPFLPAAATSLKFSETVELVGKKIRQAIQTRQVLSSEWSSIAGKTSEILWDYLETLEGCVTELFQQLDQVGVEDWSIEFSHIVDGIKEILLHRLDDLNWAIRRLEHQLHEYRWDCETRKSSWAFLKKSCIFWQGTLDRALRPNLEKCRKYLGFRYKKFSDQYERYIDMHTAIELVVDKFSEVQVFNKLDPETQDKFKRLYRLVKLWHLNSEERALPRRDTIRAVRNAMSPERAQVIFKEYDQQLWRALFEKSDLIKELPAELIHRGNINRVQEQLTGFRIELQTLLSTLSTYREFLFKSDPGVRAKPYLGFSEWTVGPENPEMKRFSILAEDLKRLDEVLVSFGKALDSKGVSPEPSLEAIDGQVQSVLREMKQPLISLITMQGRSERFVKLLEGLDILSNSDKRCVEYVGQSLNKAMRADWQYQTLFALPGFHHLYSLYRGLTGPLNERNHLNRLQKFKRLIQQLELWVKNQDTPRHTHEIELDLNDLKGYLQDFLASAQRLSRDEAADRESRISDAVHQLIEYRYIFGNFFHHLMDDSVEARTLRKQLLFVDQYFEAVDNSLK